MATLENGVTFTCSNGGKVRMIDTASRLGKFGLDDAGFAFYDDLYVNPTVPVTLDISDSYDVQAEVQHVTGDPVMYFSLISREPNGKADMRITGLKPDAWYRLQFNGVLAKTAGGRAHKQTDSNGVLRFSGVELPTS